LKADKAATEKEAKGKKENKAELEEKLKAINEELNAGKERMS